jgi:hypothetical protein
MLPSASQGKPADKNCNEHEPVSGSHFFLAHAVSASVEQTMTVAALILQIGLVPEVSQNKLPLQALPSSNCSQSLSTAQEQMGLGSVPAWQAPCTQLSNRVQGSPSSQSPLATGVFSQPLSGSQLSVVQTLSSPQVSDTVMARPTQLPSKHWSLSVQASLSWHGAVLLAKAQPLVGSQPSLVQGLASLQIAGRPTQVPPVHVSPVVQAVPSSQLSVLATEAQAPVAGSQVSKVQGLSSSQAEAEPEVQALSAHTSPSVQASPSSQAAVLGKKTQPSALLQLSRVHGLLSAHLIA